MTNNELLHREMIPNRLPMELGTLLAHSETISIPVRQSSLEKDLSGLVISLETGFRTSQALLATSGLVNSLENQPICLIKNIPPNPDWLFLRFRTGSGLKLDRFSDLNFCFIKNDSGLVFRGFRTKV